MMLMKEVRWKRFDHLLFNLNLKVFFIVNFALSLQVPGFRPGKVVPESILLSYVGKDNVRRATIESILKRTLPHAMSSVRLS